MLRQALKPALVVLAGAALVAGSPSAASRADNPSGPSAHCSRIDLIAVPGAEVQKTACLDDLTTAATVDSGHTDPDDGAGLHVVGTTNPSGVPGVQVDGYFPDTSTFNTHHG
jgi:hypothetical protein